MISDSGALFQAVQDNFESDPFYSNEKPGYCVKT